MNRTESAAKGLYYSWLYAGDRASARLFAPEMDSLSRSVSFDVKSTKLLQSLTLECGTKLSSHQTLASNQSYVGLTVRSFLGKRFTWQQSYGYTEQNLYFGLATQHSYFTQVNLTAQPGMEIGIGTHLLSTFQENVYLNTQTTQNSYLSAIVIKKRLSDVEVGSLGAIGKITGVTHWQLASWLTVFPLGSPVWFLTGNVNYHAPTFLVRKPLALKFGTGGIIGKRISIFSEFCHSHEVVTVNGAMAFPLNNGIPNDYRISALFSWYINKRFSLAAIWLYEQKQLRYLTWEWDRNEFFFMNSFYLLLSLRPF
ncbi:MAG: hypothetical protein NZ108_03755, partial [Bacteroidia bacterium]|nr:hypothetical protein [Bacteroidia bacterium]